MTLDIEKFNPTKAELTKKVNQYKLLTINGVEDKTGYQLVDTARKDLKKIRVEIEKTGKELRSDAIKFQKDVIAKEKEFVALIEPLEKELQAKQNEVDLIKEKEERKILLPERKEKLKAINLELSDDEILEMDSNGFSEFYNSKRFEYLEEQERIANEAIEKSKRLQELENARKEGEEKARKEAQEEVERLKQEAKEKEEKEEKERLEAIKKEEEENKKLEKRKEYIKFLEDNGYIEGSDEFKISQTPEKIILFKKVAEFNK